MCFEMVTWIERLYQFVFLYDDRDREVKGQGVPRDRSPHLSECRLRRCGLWGKSSASYGEIYMYIRRIRKLNKSSFVSIIQVNICVKNMISACSFTFSLLWLSTLVWLIDWGRDGGNDGWAWDSFVSWLQSRRLPDNLSWSHQWLPYLWIWCKKNETLVLKDLKLCCLSSKHVYKLLMNCFEIVPNSTIFLKL